MLSKAIDRASNVRAFRLIYCFLLFATGVYIGCWFLYNKPQNNLLIPPTNRSLPSFIKPKEALGLNCTSIYDDPKFNYSSYESERVHVSGPQNEAELPMDCNSIRQRAYFHTEDLYPEEAEFPIAFARTVFMDYRLIEIDLAALYTPHNFYCYALDLKSAPLFHKRMNALASCFPNVFIAEKKFSMNSKGHNMTYSQYQCMLTLSKPEYKWKYMVMLQNHDIPLKTNQEMIQIFKWFNGSNDVASWPAPKERINPNVTWSFEDMHLFKNESRNRLVHNGHEPKMQFAKSMVHVSLSRAMINFMLYDINFESILKNFEWDAFAIDELIMASLNSADAIDPPGGFTTSCSKYKIAYWTMTRWEMWLWDVKNCSTIARHSVCILGMEHLRVIANVPQLFANKVIPSYDFGAAVCWYEEHFRRTHFDRGLHRLASNIYLNLPHVRFNRERNRLGDKFNVTQFVCKSKDNETDRWH
ncbi:Beta-1,3-galactosyl-O-glycosyl-glycoprotein beta-1,6-N-acetylglucosaminyltransferase 3 [Aphelenchoides besseyi]|nr:Beta-1,3-galactosyl-O-glycosyl-glycoprotein beta-1,6-N-acetylglucosaminyltransferase 3 [Aphelenchoides besseyi]